MQPLPFAYLLISASFNQQQYLPELVWKYQEDTLLIFLAEEIIFLCALLLVYNCNALHFD